MRAYDEILTSAELATLLNRCVAIGCDAERGYRAAAEDVRSSTLKAVFAGYEVQRACFVAAIQSAVDELGAIHRNAGSAAGALHRGWTGLRLTVAGRHDAAILDECARGDAAALRGYDDVLHWAEVMPAQIRGLLIFQREAIARALDDVKRRIASTDLGGTNEARA